MTDPKRTRQLTHVKGAKPPALAPRFRELFDAEFNYVCRALRRLGVREADLKDVAQELMIAVYTHFDDFDSSRPVRPWLFGFALRYASNYRRLAAYKRISVEPTHLASKELGHDRYEARDTVQHGLEALEYDQRVVLVMHDLEGFGAPEIAEKTGVPLNTVYSRLRLARDRFRSGIVSLRGAS